MNYIIPQLPLKKDFDIKEILKKLTRARSALKKGFEEIKKIDFVVREMGVTRLTATRYLNELVKIGLMRKEKKGRESYYINVELFKLFSSSIVG